jgi:hypothetical protein
METKLHHVHGRDMLQICRLLRSQNSRTEYTTCSCTRHRWSICAQGIHILSNVLQDVRFDSRSYLVTYLPDDLTTFSRLYHFVENAVDVLCSRLVHHQAVEEHSIALRGGMQIFPCLFIGGAEVVLQRVQPLSAALRYDVAPLEMFDAVLAALHTRCRVEVYFAKGREELGYVVTTREFYGGNVRFIVVIGAVIDEGYSL